MSKNLSGYTLLISLIADPIRHSLSPKMHNHAFEHLGLDYAYLAFEVDNKHLEDAVDGIRALGIRGSNVSMPNKQAIIPYLDELSPEAKLIGAVNTVVNQDGLGYLKGYNTDGIGAMRALEEEGVNIAGQKVTISGAGGAGTAIAIQAALDGAKEIHVYNIKDETYANGERTVTLINEQTSTKASIKDLADQASFKESILSSRIYIDATGVGMKPLENQSLISDPAMIHPDLVVFDVVYSPAETELLKFAKANGAKKAINGLNMMLFQGAEAFRLFTGEEMPVDYIKSVLFGGEADGKH